MSDEDDDESEFNDQQRGPLGITGASVALSAGAGCGKTTVLTARFLGALDGNRTGHGRRPLSALVALTFTEKAARELRKRIRAECHRKLARAKGDDVGHWRSVLRGLEAAPVGTFHEYCAALLRGHALDAGVDPDFQVLDASLADSVRDEALTRSVRGWLAARNADLIELAVEYGLRSVRESLDSLVGSRSADDLNAWAKRSDMEIVAAWRSFWEREGRPALIGKFLDGSRACERLLAANECRHNEMSKRRLILLDGLRDLRDASDPSGLLTTILESARVQGGGKAEHWPSSEVFEEVKTRLSKLREAVKKLLERLTIDEAVSLHCAAHGLRFARLALEARQAYDEAKRVRGGLDFDDLLVKARELLKPDQGVAKGDAGRGVEFVLVDEFQDTDPVQADILKFLGRDAYTRGGLFVVGDFKQSIYRFRGARPRLFQEVRGAFPVEGRHELTENFRSAVGVVDFVNALFADAFPGENTRLIPGPHSAPAAEGPAVEFVWAQDEEKENPTQKVLTGVNALRRAEARWLAQLIRTRLDAGWMIRDRQSKQVRRAEEKDVAFLFRAMTDLAPYENALKAEGIDFHVVGGKAFYAQQEVLDLVNVLSVIEDPLDSVALAGALRGPFLGLSDDALYRLGGSGTGALADALTRFGSLDGLSELDQARAARARQMLARWRGLKDRVPIAELVDRVLDESGFESALLGEFLGDRKRANARKLVRLARRFDARGGFTLGHFVKRLRDDLREPPREEQASTTEEEGASVRLMSIHQSKGLEFPIVIVPDLNRKQDLPRKPVAFHAELGPLVRPGTLASAEPRESDDEEGSGRSLGWVAYEAVERVEEEAESIRLFYVATTRARDHLILSAGGGPDLAPVSAALRLLDERFDRHSGASRATLPEGWNAPTVRVTTECPPRSAPPRGRTRRPNLQAIARLIEKTSVREITTEPIVTAQRPRFVDLDAARGLSPRLDRLDRLVRLILLDPRAVSPGMLENVARIAARRQQPLSHPDLAAEAIGLLEPWLTGRFGAEIARAVAVERGRVWSVLRGETVYQGRAEFLLREPDGSCRVILFSLLGATEAVERLRLLLCVQAAEEQGFGRVARGWRVRLGDGLHGEDDFRDDVIEAAISEALAVLSCGSAQR